MPHEDFVRFRQLVLEDTALQESLMETADTQTFIALARRLGAERGCHFSAEDVQEAMRAARRTWRERWV
ncbi:Nif11-like leader peptide family natural product precursor [Myxococcus sp. RHSTA-1-4]|uniref:Nif11-like leader peptide family natural product precursor n=1 Tax=Myxococcus sp. RHSTA-1-4 TaxID=2874601 RepID=UPI001CBDC988|nr:Nif11-like leader peptide family natural product precursor [Myxococcus sp. RHSTA-1-4]MBZ4420919.1 Nif11-like leader peptide family natural product precursor [Myxococcus sp. RHSTA-1-4]